MQNRSIKDYSLVGARGMAMGAADVVPGVSGGTIALLTGIYDELLHSLKSLGPEALLTLFKQGPKVFWQKINGSFLLSLFLGILISIKSFAALIGYCLDHYPLLVWAFFTGLIAASVVLLWAKESAWGLKEWVALVCGIVVVVVISMARPVELPESNWLMFMGGFIAIVAMILPGISGSFILLLLGLYPRVLAAVNSNDFVALILFMLGAICGLLVFSRFLSWLLDNYHKTTLAVLIGFLMGSLNVTWPWKVTLESFVDRHGEVVPLVQSNVLPAEFTQLSAQNAQLLPVIGMMFIGFFLVLLTELLLRKPSRIH